MIRYGLHRLRADLVRAMHARGSGEAARRAKRGRTRLAICVSRVLLDGLQKRETARSLNENVQLVLQHCGKTS